MKKKLFILILCLSMLSGCGNLSQTLIKKAENYAAGKQEEAYYFQSSGYRMKELLETYTAECKTLTFTYAELKSEEKPDGWEEEMMIASDSCVSSSYEMHQVLEEAFTSAALGASLIFNRNNFLPQLEEIEAWMKDYVNMHPLDTLGLTQLTIYQKETLSERFLYLIFSYETGLDTIKELRMQTKEASEILIDELIDGFGTEAVSDMQKAEAVWSFFTEQVRYPAQDELTDACWRADGAILEQKAVSQGFAAAVSLLCSMLELENEVVAEQYELKDEEFVWRILNRVKLDGEWYRMDCCFGAATQGNRDFFLEKE